MIRFVVKIFFYIYFKYEYVHMVFISKEAKGLETINFTMSMHHNCSSIRRLKKNSDDAFSWAINLIIKFLHNKVIIRNKKSNNVNS